MASGSGVGGLGKTTLMNLYISIVLAAWKNLERFPELFSWTYGHIQIDSGTCCKFD